LANQAAFWQRLADGLERHGSAVLMIVVGSEGSSPGKAGAKMAVLASGECFGTIGGGAVEHRLVEKAQSLLTQGLFQPCLSRQRHNLLGMEGQATGMLCGGEQTVLLYGCQASDSAVCHLAGNMQGMLTLSPDGMAFDPARILAGQGFLQTASSWRYEENVGLRKQVYLIGGGHVSLALSKILAMLDFEITVIDERDNLDTLKRNADAHHKKVMPYRYISDAIPEGNQVFVFIMTHSHKTDEKVAERLAGKKVRYLGLLGSRNKIAQIKANLGAKLPAETLQRIRGPIGLPINSHTPEEIAVSIAAELIQMVNGGDSEGLIK
jgi:xanthine dehydrogenase accessory factor